MNQQEEDEFVRTAFHGDYRTMKLEDTFRLAIRAAVAHEREQWTSVRTIVSIGQHIRPYEPISDEKVNELFDDIRMGLDDRAAAIRRGE